MPNSNKKRKGKIESGQPKTKKRKKDSPEQPGSSQSLASKSSKRQRTKSIARGINNSVRPEGAVLRVGVWNIQDFGGGFSTNWALCGDGYLCDWIELKHTLQTNIEEKTEDQKIICAKMEKLEERLDKFAQHIHIIKFDVMIFLEMHRKAGGNTDRKGNPEPNLNLFLFGVWCGITGHKPESPFFDWNSEYFDKTDENHKKLVEAMGDAKKSLKTAEKASRKEHNTKKYKAIQAAGLAATGTRPSKYNPKKYENIPQYQAEVAARKNFNETVKKDIAEEQNAYDDAKYEVEKSKRELIDEASKTEQDDYLTKGPFVDGRDAAKAEILNSEIKDFLEKNLIEKNNPSEKGSDEALGKTVSNDEYRFYAAVCYMIKHHFKYVIEKDQAGLFCQKNYELFEDPSLPKKPSAAWLGVERETNHVKEKESGTKDKNKETGTLSGPETKLLNSVRSRWRSMVKYHLASVSEPPAHERCTSDGFALQELTKALNLKLKHHQNTDLGNHTGTNSPCELVTCESQKAETVGYICRNGWSLEDCKETDLNPQFEYCRPAYNMKFKKSAASGTELKEFCIIAAHAPGPSHWNKKSPDAGQVKKWMTKLKKHVSKSFSTEKCPVFLGADMNMTTVLANDDKEFFDLFTPGLDQHESYCTSYKQKGRDKGRWSEPYDKLLIRKTEGDQVPPWNIQVKREGRWEEALAARRFSDHSFLIADVRKGNEQVSKYIEPPAPEVARQI